MRRLLHKVLGSEELRNAPPVLVDIGASGGLPRQWRSLAPYSIGIAFDADSREFQADGQGDSRWRKLFRFNRLVSKDGAAQVDFHLTRSPFCSSMLRPDGAALAPWAFSELFAVERTVALPSMELSAALREAGVDRVDWFKCDTQGTDLRLFRSLPDAMRDRVLVADFEPGIIDAYQGEDKLHHVLAYMDGQPFWVAGMKLRGSQRVAADVCANLGALQRRRMSAFLKTSPGWAEITFCNRCDGAASRRDLLLAWVFAVQLGQYGYGLQVARTGSQRFGGDPFDELAAACLARMRRPSPALLARLALRAFEKLG